MSVGIFFLVLIAVLFVAWFIIVCNVQNKRPDDNIVINVDRRGGVEDYQYSLPNQKFPFIIYRRDSYCVQFVPRSENTPTMICTSNVKVLIRGKEEMKLLAEALALIGKMER